MDSTGDDVDLLKNDWQDLAEAVVKALATYIGIPYDSNDSYYIVQKGDVDRNGSITILDVRLLLQAYIEMNSSTELTALDYAIMDMDNSNTIDIMDVRLLLQDYINKA